MKFGQERGVRIRHYVVSFKNTEFTVPMIANLIANEIMTVIGGKFQCVYVVHENTGELHFHLAFNTVNYLDGSRFKGNKTEHIGLMNVMKYICRSYGFIAYYVKNTYDAD